MKEIIISVDGDWTCPYCKQDNNTGIPDGIVQCSWCMNCATIVKEEAKP